MEKSCILVSQDIIFDFFKLIRNMCLSTNFSKIGSDISPSIQSANNRAVKKRSRGACRSQRDATCKKSKKVETIHIKVYEPSRHRLVASIRALFDYIYAISERLHHEAYPACKLTPKS